MKYVVGFGVFVTLLLSIGLVQADSCATPFVKQNQVVVAPVVTPVVIAQFVAVPVVVPTYQVGYDPYANGIAEELKLLRQELKSAREALTGGGIPANALPLVEPSPAQKVLQTHCASCHTGASARKGFQIFHSEGRLNPDVDKFTLWDVAERQVMPPDPKPKVHPDDVKVLRDWVRSK